MQPLLQWIRNKYYILWVCISSLSYPACNAHARDCHLWPSRLCSVFPHYFIKGAICKKKGGGGFEHKICVVIFSTTFTWDIPHTKKNWVRYDQKYILVVMQRTRFSCQILIILEFSRHIFGKYSSIKFYENPYSGSRFVSFERTDGHDGTWFQASAAKYKNSVLLCYYAANSGNFLPTFRDNLLAPSVTMGSIGCPDTSVRDYHYSLHNNPEGRSSQTCQS